MIHLGFRLEHRSSQSDGAASATTAPFVLEVAVTLGGRATAILGPPGSGKTSLLEVIAGLRGNVVGRVVVDQTTFVDTGRGILVPTQKRGIGYVPQDPALFPHLDVRANVRYAMRPVIGAERHADEMIELLEIGGLLSRFPRTLSGGEARRVALARALVTKPRLLLLDEPLASIDAVLKNRVLPHLIRIRDEAKVPMLYVTHHAGDVVALADEAIILQAGRVEGKGPAREVLTPSALSSVQLDAALENIVDGVVIEMRPDGMAVLAPLGGGPTDSPTGELTLLVPSRPGLVVGERVAYRVASEDILLLREKPDGISAHNVLRGIVIEVEPSGHDAIVRVATSGLEWRVRVTSAAVRELGIDPGHEIWTALKTHRFERLG